jgi:hypothetical protein
MAFYSFLWLFTAFYSFLRLLRLFMAFYSFLWLFTAFYGFLWLFTAFYGFLHFSTAFKVITHKAKHICTDFWLLYSILVKRTIFNSFYQKNLKCWPLNSRGIL